MGQSQARQRGVGGKLPEHDHSGDAPCPGGYSYIYDSIIKSIKPCQFDHIK